MTIKRGDLSHPPFQVGNINNAELRPLFFVFLLGALKTFMAATRSSRSNLRLSTSSIPSVKPSSSLTESPADTPTFLNRRTDDVFQSIIKGRKSWKTARGGEIVWPPELESALIEGACLDARSPPSSSRSIKLNQQNRFGKLPAR